MKFISAYLSTDRLQEFLEDKIRKKKLKQKSPLTETPFCDYWKLLKTRKKKEEEEEKRVLPLFTN